MQIDRKSLDKLLTLNDRQLGNVINKIARESGLDLSSFNVNPSDIASVRKALSTATEEDIIRATQQYEEMKRNGGKAPR